MPVDPSKYPSNRNLNMDVVKRVYSTYEDRVDEIYKRDIYDSPEGDFICPVCMSKFDKKSDCQEHLKEQKCLKMSRLFEDTKIENYVYLCFKETISHFKTSCINKINTKSLQYFRNSFLSDYFFVLYFAVESHKVNLDEFLEYIILNVGEYLYPYHLSGYADNSNIIRFKVWRRNNRNENKLKRFIINNRNKLKDPDFILKSLETGNLTYDYIEKKVLKEEMLNKFTGPQLEYLQKLMEERSCSM